MPSEPPSYDGHREGTFGMVHPLAPHYNTLLRIDPFDRTGTRWSPTSPSRGRSRQDGLTYTLKLRQGVKFHDGTEMTSRDVKASYDKIVFPPEGVRLVPQGRLPGGGGRGGARPAHDRVPAEVAVGLVPHHPGLALQLDLQGRHPGQGPRWYEKNVMGTGPFKFVEHVKGSHWVGKKNPDYWDKGKPYLDGYRAIFISDVLRPGGGHPRASGRTSSSVASARPSATASCRRSARRSRCRRARGTACCWWR